MKVGDQVTIKKGFELNQEITTRDLEGVVTWLRNTNGTVSHVTIEEVENYVSTYEQHLIVPLDEWKPTRGELVKTREGNRIFLTEIEGAHSPYICVSCYSEEKFKSGKKFPIACWEKIEQITPYVEMTISEIEEELNMEEGALKIIDEKE